MLAFFTALCLFSVLTVAPPAAAMPLVVEAQPIALHPAAPAHTQVGNLRFLRGYQLRSSHPHFGGLSGLALDPTGKVLYAVSDHGFGLSARLFHDAGGHLVYMDSWEIVPLQTPAGQVVDRQQHDAEALIRDADDSFLIAFEQMHRLWRYPPSPVPFTTLPQPLQVPSELVDAPANRGIEAMTRLHGGQLLLLTEQFKNPDGSCKGWIIGSERLTSVSYPLADGYLPTDLATLPNGDVLLLERRYRPLLGIAVRIRHIASASMQAGTALKGIVIAHLQSPLNVDNFEGLAIYESTEKGTLLYLISDDNYNPLQRTLLLQFRLESPTGN
jgi:hypothetical protein